MENEELIKTVTDKAMVWLGDAYDEDIRQDVKRMLDSDDKTDLIDSFYRDSEPEASAALWVPEATV